MVIFNPSGLMLQISSGAWPSGLGVSAASCNESHVEFECVQYPSSKCNRTHIEPKWPIAYSANLIPT